DRDQTVADREGQVTASGFGQLHALHQHADGETAEDVDEGDQNAGDRVASDELVGAVHRTEEVRGFFQVAPALLGFFGVDQAGVEVGVDRHLFTGHGVQGESGCDFGDALRAFGDDDELNQHQDQEDDHTHHVVATDDEVREGVDDVTGVGIEQDRAGGGDV